MKMLSIQPIRSVGQLSYYAVADSGAPAPAVRWLGRGAEELLGYSAPRPSLEACLVAAVRKTQVTGYIAHDCTFSAPKSVSLLWASSGPDVREKLEAAVVRAAARAIELAEDHLNLSRSGHRGCHFEPASVVAGAFVHQTNRAGEPHLHLHAVVANATLRANGEWSALWSRSLFQAKHALGALFRAELAFQLVSQLGIELRNGRHSFEVAGISDALCDSFSSRSKAIRAAVAGTPWSGSAAAKGIAAVTTRPAKEASTIAALEASWKERLSDATKTRIADLAHGPGKPWPLTRTERETIWRAVVDYLTVNQAAFSKIDMLGTAARIAELNGVPANEAVQIVELGISSLHSVGNARGLEHFTTQAILDEENRLLEVSNCVKEQQAAAPLAAALAATERNHPDLTGEQRRALQHLAGDQGIALVRGLAGTGKTVLMKAAAELFAHAGLTPQFLAPTNRAVRELAQATGAAARTVASFLYADNTERLTNLDVLVVDESGLLGTQQALGVLERAAAAGAKVVLVGDDLQMQPVDRGGPFRALAARFGCAELTEIKRQKHPWLLDVVHNIAEGFAEIALWQLERRDRLVTAPTQEECVAALTDTWMRVKPHDLEGILAVTSTKSQALAANQAIQGARITAGEIDPSFCVKKDELSFCRGDRVVFMETNKKQGYCRGDFGTITASHDGRVTVALDRQESFAGKSRPAQVVIYPFAGDQEALRLGYAVSSYPAQGTSADTVLVLAAGNQDLHSGYVAASRAKHDLFFFLEAEHAESRTMIEDSLSRVRPKTLATDLVLEERKRIADEQERRRVLEIKRHEMGIPPRTETMEM